MYDWVRVLDRHNNVIFLNKAMADGTDCYETGKKCYSLLGRDCPCENCVSRESVFDGHPHEKEEIFNNRVFSVMSSPVKSDNDEIIAVVEVLRDVTEMRQLQQKIINHNQSLQVNLEMAKKLQNSLLPKQFSDPSIDFSLYYKPCEMLGGDFFDIFQIDEEHIGLYIADVSGHGIPAAMLTIFLHSSIDRGNLSPSIVLNDLYKRYNYNNFDTDLYITVFYAIIDLKKKVIKYSNAGHGVSPIIFKDNRFDLLRVPGIPISNWIDEPAYEDMIISFDTGDKLFLYTDGLVELRNKSGEQFGEERLLATLLPEAPNPEVTIKRISESINEFILPELSENDIIDDITMVLLEHNKDKPLSSL